MVETQGSIYESAAALPQLPGLTPRSDTVFNNDKIIHSRRTDFISFESNKFKVTTPVKRHNYIIKIGIIFYQLECRFSDFLKFGMLF